MTETKIFRTFFFITELETLFDNRNKLPTLTASLTSLFLARKKSEIGYFVVL